MGKQKHNYALRVHAHHITMLQKAKVANFVPRSSIIFPAYADLSHSPPSWNSWIDNQFLNGYKSLINIVRSFVGVYNVRT